MVEVGTVWIGQGALPIVVVDRVTFLDVIAIMAAVLIVEDEDDEILRIKMY